MLNKKPIFVLGLQRGGTKLLIHLLASHQDVCIPGGETHQVFRGVRRRPISVQSLKTRLSRFWKYIPILIRERRDIFSIHSYELRHQLSPGTIARIDKVFFESKLKSLAFYQNLYKAEGVEYSPKERANSRLLTKNVQGLIFATDLFQKMYPDATFIALVRDGLAVCEGHIRRGANLLETAQLYEKCCQKMISDSKELEKYRIFRYEDLLQEPLQTLRKIYEFADLDMNLVPKVRFVNNKIITAEGKHQYVDGVEQGTLIWYGLENFHQFLDPGLNENQIKRLTKGQKKIILEQARNSLEHFSYI